APGRPVHLPPLTGPVTRERPASRLTLRSGPRSRALATVCGWAGPDRPTRCRWSAQRGEVPVADVAGPGCWRRVRLSQRVLHAVEHQKDTRPRARREVVPGTMHDARVAPQRRAGRAGELVHAAVVPHPRVRC